MKLPKCAAIKIYGDIKYRGDCPQEALDQVTFFNRIRKHHSETFGIIALHPRNEGLRHHNQVAREKSEGMSTGASDIIIPGCPAFVCELKRSDHTKSTITDEQINYLTVCKENGAFVCIALGADAATAALNDWIAVTTQLTRNEK